MIKTGGFWVSVLTSWIKGAPAPWKMLKLKNTIAGRAMMAALLNRRRCCADFALRVKSADALMLIKLSRPAKLNISRPIW